MKKYACLLLIIILSVIKANANPSELYNSAWKALAENYYDKSMNNQDWNRWKTRYQNLVNYEDAYMAIDTMTESLDDPYTVFMKPYEYKEEILDMDGKTLLFGINIRKSKDKYIVCPLKGGAAEKAGIRKNDILLAINGKLIKDIPANEFGTLFDLSDSEYLEFTIKRKFSENKVYKISPAKQDAVSIYRTPFYSKTKVPAKIGYFRISSFMDRNLANKFQEILENSDDKYDSYIIDLRGNSGGIAKNAAVIANMLLCDKEILSIVDRDGNKKVISSNSDVLTEKPIVVLVDRNSASASEIFTASMKENKRGTVIGEKTFGKGIMQDIVELVDGCGMNITVKYYLTPAGNFIHKKGIEPDICIKMTKSDYIRKNDRVLKYAIKFLQKS